MTIFHSVLFGILEGITEFLPISSTAHLDILRLLLDIQATAFVKSFEIAIQLGAIGAVAVLYGKKIFSSFLYFRNIVIAFIPTGIIGFLLYKLIKTFLLGNTLVAALALVLGGVLIILYESRKKILEKDGLLKQVESLTVKQLLVMGCAQALAVVPGVSRSGAVIISGLMMGLPRKLITEFSFILAVPTMLAAVFYDLYKSGFSFSEGDWGTIAVGFIVSFIVAMLVIKWLLGYIRNHSFAVFGWYRIVIGIVILLLLFV